MNHYTPRRIQLEGEQIEARRLIMDYAFDPAPRAPFWSLKGLAGTGKTSIFADVALDLPGAIACTFTGKAASVLGRKTGMHVTTVHGAIMAFLGKSRDDRGKEELWFKRHVMDGRWTGRHILLDEDSMIPEDLARDLIATGARVITCGDMGQLPPVRGIQFFSRADFQLTQIRRQAWDSPIIRQAHAVRSGGTYQTDTDAFRVTGFVTAREIVDCDIILCWRNATRQALNTLKRQHLGLLSAWPVVGEPLMCLKNDHEMGVLNGAVYTMLDIRDSVGGHGDLRGRGLDITVVNERDEEVTLRNTWFEGLDENTREEDYVTGFTFSYAATVHKGQGSEWKNLIIVDEYSRRDDRERWLYTAITRASERVLIQRNW